MGKVFLVDIAKCNGCHNCQIVCKDEHCGNDWRPYAAEQPDTGQFWCRLDEKVRGQAPVVRISYTPLFCAHCADAPCARACAASAFERRDDGLLILSPEKCTGCMTCIDACPQGAIFFNEDLHIAQKCTGCAHLLDNGWDVPRCVDACAHDAILYKEESEFGDLLNTAELLESTAPYAPRVYFLNLPQRFVAGAIVDFKADEVVIGAQVSLLSGDEILATTETDDFGDFKFDQVPAGIYTIVVEKDDYEKSEILADITEIDLCVGDLALNKK
jgi:Fe-S-cluster-containing dehydrogenase component